MFFYLSPVDEKPIEIGMHHFIGLLFCEIVTGD